MHQPPHFYNWPDFKTISTWAWIENTWDDIPGAVKVKIENREHRVTVIQVD